MWNFVALETLFEIERYYLRCDAPLDKKNVIIWLMKMRLNKMKQEGDDYQLQAEER